MDDDLVLLELAASISDGVDVDWEERLGEHRNAGRAVLARRLWEVAQVAEASRGLWAASAAQGEVDDIVGGATATLPGQPEEPKLPFRWGRLDVVAHVGHGGFGRVYLALDRELRRDVALKFLKIDRASGGKRALVREGRRLARVRHPNVATVHGVEEHDGRVGLWSEFVRGRPLDQQLEEQGPFGAREALLIGVDLCRALAAVHAAGLLHGDVKPGNVVRQEGGRIVLMDFGAGLESLPDGQAATGEIGGTPLYMAPELLLGGRSSVRADLYSLGVLLYRLTTKRFPLEAETWDQLREAHRWGRRVLLRDARPDLPQPFVLAVERALESDPARRFQTAGEMERALVEALGAVEGEASRGASTGSRARVWWPAAAVVGLLGIAGLAVWQPWNGADLKRPAGGAAVGAVTTPRALSGLAIEAHLFCRREGRLLAEPLQDGDAVQPGDELYLEVEAAKQLFWYVINRDQQGRGYVLFPLPGAGAKNPVAGGMRHRLPGSLHRADRGASVWLVDSAGGWESFLLIASSEPLPELDRVLPLLAVPETDDTGVVNRGVGRTRAAREQPSGITRRLEDTLQALRQRDDVWIRELVVDNPGAASPKQE